MKYIIAESRLEENILYYIKRFLMLMILIRLIHSNMMMKPAKSGKMKIELYFTLAIIMEKMMDVFIGMRVITLAQLVLLVKSAHWLVLNLNIKVN